MRVVVLVRATKNSEAGVLPSQKLMADMWKYNEQLIQAGVLLAGEGLQASANAKRVHFADGKKTVIDGPFTASKELIAGFWLWNVGSMDEALDWIKRCPHPSPGEESMLEIRPVFEAEQVVKAVRPNRRTTERRTTTKRK